MNLRTHIIPVALCVLLLAVVDTGLAQRGPRPKARMTTEEILAAVKPGQWVQLEGKAQRDLSVLCAEVKILTGDFLDDDWGISATTRRVDKKNRQFYLLNLPVKVQKDAEFENEAGTFHGFNDLKEKMLVELEGTYLKDGTFLAKEVEDESHKLTDEQIASEEVEVVGRVGKVDVKRRTITVMGIKFVLTDLTSGKSAAH